MAVRISIAEAPFSKFGSEPVARRDEAVEQGE
jgi:hypothetical protein